MTTAIHLCGPEQEEQLLTLIARCHDELGITSTPEHRKAAATPLLRGAPQGAAYLFGPARAPTGYVVVSFGWSIQLGGMTATIDDIYIRPSVRRRGIGREVVHAIARMLKAVSVRAMHLRSEHSETAYHVFGQVTGFSMRDDKRQMTRML